TSWFAPPPPSLRKAHERGGRGVARSDQTSVVVPANLEHVFWFFWIAIRLRVAECERQSNISNLGCDPRSNPRPVDRSAADRASGATDYRLRLGSNMDTFGPAPAV